MNSISKYLVASVIRVGCAPPIWKRTRVQRRKESRITIGGDEDQSPLRRFDKARDIVQTALLECNASGKIGGRLYKGQAQDLCML